MGVINGEIFYLTGTRSNSISRKEKKIELALGRIKNHRSTGTYPIIVLKNNRINFLRHLRKKILTRFRSSGRYLCARKVNSLVVKED